MKGEEEEAKGNHITTANNRAQRMATRNASKNVEVTISSPQKKQPIKKEEKASPAAKAAE